jgi:hypothetical protein
MDSSEYNTRIAQVHEVRVLTDTHQISRYRDKVILAGLKLELLGMKRRGPSCYKMAKMEFGLKGSKQKVYDQLKAVLDGTLGAGS